MMKCRRIRGLSGPAAGKAVVGYGAEALEESLRLLPEFASKVAPAHRLCFLVRKQGALLPRSRVRRSVY